MSDTGGRTRREILADAAKVAAAASVAGLAACFPDVGGRWPSGTCVDPDAGANANASPPRPVTPTVVEVSNPNSVDAKSIIQPDEVAKMLDAGLTALAQQAALFNATLPPVDAGADDSDADTSDGDAGVNGGHAGQTDQGSDADNPWRVLLPKYRPGMCIGLKVNCLSPYVPTSPALVHAIVVSLRDKLGVDPSKIVVWDRRLDELNNHGKYSADDLAGARLLGTVLAPPPRDGGIAETSSEGQPGYGDMISPTIECQSPRLSRILTDLTALTINCPVFKRHGVSGVTAAMKNIYGIIDIPDSYHKPIHTGLPRLYALPAIRNSISLTIVDALIAEVNSDTADPSDATPKRILLAQDPVAMDSYALVLLNQVRALIGDGLPPIQTSLTRWIDNAEALGLGTKNYSLIKLSD